ncbi:dTDP-4-dehydrorhamnose reductase family protein [Salinithrix halophila]|uniref:dTDP-4-dehydrorhamnose reductase n=1 Tax=Salinithrix halophila TaxID=1485204 RepID=A0ABV8JI82_9BACL
MKILVIGATGMAGHMIRDYLLRETNHEIWSTARVNREKADRYLFLNVQDGQEVTKVLTRVKPDVVVNAVGILNRNADQHPSLAVEVNGKFPKLLSRLGLDLGYRLIHISTDCVFSGKRGNYTETDIRDATGAYAETKKMGEEIDSQHLVIRTSIIGPELKEGIGLFHWFMQQKGTIRGYRQAWWNGVTTLELAKAVKSVLEQPVKGLVHLCHPEKICKHDLLLLIQQVFGQTQATVEPDDTFHCDKSLVNTRSDFPYVPPNYSSMLEELRNGMKKSSEPYNQYGIGTTKG